MSDTATPAAGQQSAEPMVRFLAQYIKDFSFEVPNAPGVYLDIREQSPEIPVSIDCEARAVDAASNTFEVAVMVHAKASIGEKTVFILELAYGAFVRINPEAVPQEHIHPVLLIEVPRLVFPFVRQVIGDATIGGGFPPLLLQMVDFTELYRRKYANAAQGAQAVPDAAPQAAPAG